MTTIAFRRPITPADIPAAAAYAPQVWENGEWVSSGGTVSGKAVRQRAADAVRRASDFTRLTIDNGGTVYLHTRDAARRFQPVPDAQPAALAHAA
ncbi:hypothetical protein ACU686_26655 [Yinghuangia aomiensis]